MCLAGWLKVLPVVVNTKRSLAALTVVAAITATTLTAPSEGLSLKPYHDIANPSLITVCYGETHNVQNRKYTLAECKARLDNSMLNAVRIVDGCHPGLPDNVLIAFSDAVYNMGPTIACDRELSHAAIYLDNKDYNKACNEITKWNKQHLPGIYTRRAKERFVCLTPTSLLQQ